MSASLPLHALVFDVDGTLADTEMAHLAAFNHAFAEMGLDWRWDASLYTALLDVSGGKERIRAYWKSREALPKDAAEERSAAALIERLHEIKTAAYDQAVKEGRVQMRPGVMALLEEALEAGMPLAIATTTTPANIASLLQRWIGAGWEKWFAVIEDASTAPCKKPHPMAYRQALRRLRYPAAECIAFEDSANGLQAARAAGLATVITPNRFTAHHDFAGALHVRPDLSGVSLVELRNWHAKSTASCLLSRAGGPP